MAFLGTQSKNMKRVNEIVDVLIKYEVEYLIEQSNFFKRLPFRNKKEEELDLDETFEMRIRLSFEELGATFIKKAYRKRIHRPSTQSKISQWN